MGKRILVVGAACAGKTTLCRHLRTACGVVAIDTNDEILRLNNGAWPSIDRKNQVLLPMVLDAVMTMEDVVLFNSYMPALQMSQLRRAGFRTVLLDVSEAELRRRHRARFAEEGWTNVQWLEWNQNHINELRNADQFDDVICGEQDVASVASEILRLAQR